MKAKESIIMREKVLIAFVLLLAIPIVSAQYYPIPKVSLAAIPAEWLNFPLIVSNVLFPGLVIFLLIWGILYRIRFPRILAMIISFFLALAIVFSGFFVYLVSTITILGFVALFFVAIFLLPHGEKISRAIIVKARIREEWVKELDKKEAQLEKIKAEIAKESAKSRPSKSKIKKLEVEKARLEDEIEKIKEKLGYA